jgi:hypothetical protein
MCYASGAAEADLFDRFISAVEFVGNKLLIRSGFS